MIYTWYMYVITWHMTILDVSLPYTHFKLSNSFRYQSRNCLDMSYTRFTKILFRHVIYLVYTRYMTLHVRIEPIKLSYTWHIPCTYHVFSWYIYIPGIYQVYTGYVLGKRQVYDKLCGKIMRRSLQQRSHRFGRPSNWYICCLRRVAVPSGRSQRASDQVR